MGNCNGKGNGEGNGKGLQHRGAEDTEGAEKDSWKRSKPLQSSVQPLRLCASVFQQFSRSAVQPFCSSLVLLFSCQKALHGPARGALDVSGAIRAIRGFRGIAVKPPSVGPERAAVRGDP